MARKKIIVVGILIFTAFAVLVGSLTLKKEGAGVSTSKNQVGVIFIEGPIVDSGGQSLFGGVSDSRQIMRQIRTAAEDPVVKAVVLRINSPGGTVPATQEIGRELERLKDAGKVLVASMGDVAASGGYWLAVKTDKIYANPGTITGSIGVIMSYQNIEELYRKLGIEPHVIKSGHQKDLGSPNREMTGEERQLLQEMVDQMFDSFVTVVAEGRDLPKDRVMELATGRVWTGEQAKALALVDEMGNYYDAINGAAKMAGMTGKPSVKYFGKKRPLDTIFGGGAKKAGIADEISQWLEIIREIPSPNLLALPRDLHWGGVFDDRN